MGGGASAHYGGRMAVNTLQVANRLKAAEREGRAAEELALVLGEIDADRCQSLVTREHLAVELERLRAELARTINRPRDAANDRRSSLSDQFELRTQRLINDMTWRAAWMMLAFVLTVGATEVFF